MSSDRQLSLLIQTELRLRGFPGLFFVSHQRPEGVGNTQPQAALEYQSGSQDAEVENKNAGPDTEGGHNRECLRRPQIAGDFIGQPENRRQLFQCRIQQNNLGGVDGHRGGSVQ